MQEEVLKLLEKIEDNGFQAYIVGGYVRDYILGTLSSDVDIATNATPKDIKKIFKNSVLKQNYGSSTIYFKNIRYEITTFRREIKYQNNRKPVEYEYINSLEEDLERRDFLINTLCMNKQGEIIDIYNGRKDIEEKVINTVYDANKKFSEDVLRILRAIRFATVLNFKLSKEVIDAIKLNKYLLKNLSYTRKREELDKIFTSPNIKYGIKLILELGLDKELELDNLRNIKSYGDLLSIWARLNNDKYPFTKNEKEIMENIKNILNLKKLTKEDVYKYGLYISSIYADIKNVKKEEVISLYNNLKIKSKKDINITGKDIIKILDITPSSIVKDILDEIENMIINEKIENDYEKLVLFIENNYK